MWCHSLQTYLDNVQFGQQVAISQCHFIAVQKFPCGKLNVLHTILIDLVGEGRVQVVVQFLQGFQETSLQG